MKSYGKSKRSSKSRKGNKRRRFNISKRRGGYKLGALKVMRWSSRDTTQNCHVLLTGSDTAPDQVTSTTFMLGDVAGASELTALFDNYVIDKVLYRWVVTRNPEWATTTANRGWSTRVFWCHDFNSSIVLSQAQLFQRAGLREVYLNSDRLQSKWYSLKPAVLVKLYENSLGGESYSPKWRQWIDTSETACPHYGILAGYQNLYAGLNLRLEAKIYMRCAGIS